MKPIHLIRLLLVVFSMTILACSDNVCVLEDWTGNYVGTRNCNGVGASGEEEVAFTITKNTTFSQLPSNTVIIDDEAYLIIEGCSVIGGASEPGTLTQNLANGNLSGSKIQFKILYDGGITCDWEGEKQ